MENINVHDEVVLTVDVHGLPKGTKGTIVFEYSSIDDNPDFVPFVYEVELFDEKNNTIVVERLFKNEFEKIAFVDYTMDNMIDNIIQELDSYARDYDGYEFGLPVGNPHLEIMRNIVKNILNEKK
jgi:hypothetical protein